MNPEAVLLCIIAALVIACLLLGGIATYAIRNPFDSDLRQKLLRAECQITHLESRIAVLSLDQKMTELAVVLDDTYGKPEGNDES